MIDDEFFYNGANKPSISSYNSDNESKSKKASKIKNYDSNDYYNKEKQKLKSKGSDYLESKKYAVKQEEIELLMKQKQIEAEMRFKQMEFERQASSILNKVNEINKNKEVETTMNKKIEKEDKVKSLTENQVKYEQYLNFILYDDLFAEFKKNVAEKSSNLEKVAVINEFFEYVFSYENYDKLLDNGKLSLFNKIFLKELNEDSFYKENIIMDRIDILLNKQMCSLHFSDAVLNRNFEHAKIILPYAEQNIDEYVNTIKQIQEKNDVEALKFMCQSLKNIHYGNGELLHSSIGMSHSAIDMLIKDFKFNISEQASATGMNLIQHCVDKSLLNKFTYLIENYYSDINLSQPIAHVSSNLRNGKVAVLPEGVKSKGNKESLFDLIMNNKREFEFLSILLSVEDEKFLKQSHIGLIGSIIFTDEKIAKYAKTDIYDKFFSHPSFDAQVFNLGQGSFIYGLLSRMGICLTKNDNDEFGQNYVRILDSYINNSNIDDLPTVPEFHVVGAAIHVAKISEKPSAQDACRLVIKNFKQLINKPNPTGMLPISQVKPDSPIYRALIDNGAITPEPDPTFFKSLFKMFEKKKKVKIENNADVEDISNRSVNVGSISSIRGNLKNDFREMRGLLSNSAMDADIKMRCENMFLKADNIGSVLEKNNLNNFFDEIHFLSENFSNYLKKSLGAYDRILDGNQKIASEAFEAKVEEAKKMCLKHVKLLEDQTDLILNNIGNEIGDSVLKDLRIRGRFLEEKFDKPRVDLDKILQQSELLNPKSETPASVNAGNGSDEEIMRKDVKRMKF